MAVTQSYKQNVNSKKQNKTKVSVNINFHSSENSVDLR